VTLRPVACAQYIQRSSHFVQPGLKERLRRRPACLGVDVAQKLPASASQDPSRGIAAANEHTKALAYRCFVAAGP
jgi:hypothetical protein